LDGSSLVEPDPVAPREVEFELGHHAAPCRKALPLR